MKPERNKKKKTRKPVRRKGYVLKVTDKVIEWQEEEFEGKKPVDQIFDRLLPKFGWSQTKNGNLEHVGMDSPEDAA